MRLCADCNYEIEIREIVFENCVFTQVTHDQSSQIRDCFKSLFTCKERHIMHVHQPLIHVPS